MDYVTQTHFELLFKGVDVLEIGFENYIIISESVIILHLHHVFSLNVVPEEDIRGRLG